MTNIIAVLEKIAKDASLKNTAALKAFIEQTSLSEQEKALILAQNSEAIAAELDVKKDIVCLVVPAEDDEPSEDSEEDKESQTQNNLVVNG